MIGTSAAQDMDGGEASPNLDPIEGPLLAAVPWAIQNGPFRTQLLGAGPSPDQGWKLHVSATVGCAPQVLSRVLPVLLGAGVRFKVVSGVDQLEGLNCGAYGPWQVGKFVTVYPEDDAQAVRLAVALDAATEGLSGPRIPTDRQLRPGSLVHYRYGAFVQRDDPGGDLLDPEGRSTTDVRLPFYRPPAPSITDPFEAAGAYVPPPVRRGPIGGRYLVYDVLYRSWRGGVYLAVDAAARPARVCLLKEIWRDVGGDRDGCDARTWADNEAAVLAAHPDDPAFPRLYGRFTMHGNSYLALEYVEGVLLAEEVEDSAGRLGHESLVEIAQGSAAALAYLHELGIVYRDFKKEHVLRTPDGWRLIDFGCAHDRHVSLPPVTALGTPPWSGPDQRAGGAPDPRQDVFSWGAVMHHLACGGDFGGDPPDEQTAPAYARLPVLQLNPGVPATLAAIIDRAVAWDPGDRYESMVEVRDALRSVDGAGVRIGRGPSRRGEVAPDRPARSFDRDPIELAREIGDALCLEAEEDKGGLRWMGLERPGAPPSYPPDLYEGAAGIGLFLGALARETGNVRYADAARRTARWLAGPTWGRGRAASGLHCGQAGVGLFLMRLGVMLDEPGFVTAAELVARRLDGVEPETFDVFSGAAGLVLFLTQLAEATDKAVYLTQASPAVELLLATSRKVDSGSFWDVPACDSSCAPLPYLGFAHGAAGIGHALGEFARVSRDERALAAAVDVAEFLLAQGVADPAGGVEWARVVGDRETGLQAGCHGAAGVGTFFLRLARHVPDERFAHAARQAERTVERHAERRDRIGLCCGVAGDGNFFLECYDNLRDPRSLSSARECAARLSAFQDASRPGIYRASTSHSLVSSHFMVGTAGIGAFLLRLAAPEARGDLVLA